MSMITDKEIMYASSTKAPLTEQEKFDILKKIHKEFINAIDSELSVLNKKDALDLLSNIAVCIASDFVKNYLIHFDDKTPDKLIDSLTKHMRKNIMLDLNRMAQ